MPPLDDGLDAETQKFFETGQLPEGMANEPDIDPPMADSAPPAHVADSTPPDAQVDTTGVTPDAPPVEAPEVALLRQSLQQERQFRSQLEQRLNEIATKLQPQATPEPPLPDANDDPLGHTVAQLQRLQQQMQQIEQRMVQGTQQTEQQTQLNNFVSQVKSYRDEFAKVTPDFEQAYQHLRNIRTADLRDLGVPDDQIPQVLLREEINVSNAAMQAGKNPAKVIYEVAKRYGYATKAQPAPVAQKIEQLKKGMEAAKTSPTGTVESDLTIEGLKKMSDRDLHSVITSDDQWNKIVGGRAGGSSIF